MGEARRGSELAESRVVILGLGLMGGSLALALRGKVAALLGVDTDPATLALAQAWGVADRLSDDPAELLPLADFIILATPVSAILEQVRALPRLHPGNATVLDLGSTKADIVEAMSDLPERFDPIGGHPMCGKETASLVHAEAALYAGAPFALTPLPRTTPQGIRLAAQLVQAVGAHPVWLDPETHDRWVASTSHLPYLVAAALAAATPHKAAPLIGPGLRSTTRLAATSPQMMLDILSTNRLPILAALQVFHHQIDTLEDLLEKEDFTALEHALTQDKSWHAGLLAQANQEVTD